MNFRTASIIFALVATQSFALPSIESTLSVSPSAQTEKVSVTLPNVEIADLTTTIAHKRDCSCAQCACSGTGRLRKRCGSGKMLMPMMMMMMQQNNNRAPPPPQIIPMPAPCQNNVAAAAPPSIIVLSGNNQAPHPLPPQQIPVPFPVPQPMPMIHGSMAMPSAPLMPLARTY